MQINYCRIAGGNFGDDLNTLLWPRLFPDLHKIREIVQVFGVGSILDGKHRQSRTNVVLGSGLGVEQAAVPDCNWEFRWVRGPLTARAFGLAPTLAMGDSALLWPELQAPASLAEHGPVGLVPHCRTWDSFDWTTVARQAGMVAINPRLPPAQVIAQLRSCSLVMAESLHGAICADAMAIPWAPCVLAHRFNDFKWMDWMATIGRDFQPMVADRPLVRSIHPAKAVINRLARMLHYKSGSRRPALRPVAISSQSDVQAVVQALARHAANRDHFSCSKPADIALQRERMVAVCQTFANDYQLRFTP